MKFTKIRKKELIRFLFGGGSAVVVDYIIYQLLMLASLSQDISKALSFICGAAVGFVINKLWTFESAIFSKNEVLRYVILYSCTAIINAVVNRFTLKITALEMLAFLCATGVSTILNFLGQKFFVFRK